MRKNHLLVIDGMALLFRAFYATSIRKHFMFNSKGVPTNAVQGYLRHILSAVEAASPSHITVCWDMGSKTYRNDIFPDYKSNREAPPLELIPQFDFAKEATHAFAIPNIGVSGYEADDCIGTICSKNRHNAKMTVLTGDRDLLQVIDESVDVWLLQKGIGNYAKYTKETFQEMYQLDPHQLIDVKALMGDASDGYPGVKGIGEKTALTLIRRFGSIETLLENLADVTPSQRAKIETHLELLHISRELAAINCSTPFQFDFEKTYWNDIPRSAFDYVDEHELNVVQRQLQILKKDFDHPFTDRELTKSN
ncbi:5'-3' exonuclease [Siminovitchia sp. FSL H7-0308]|uniref:5'-3' exonuclease n=1 Tax=Siminovitchia thermophila TaxID=1245522 RepID=A0ABS2R9W0_9BACI|nr:5'-3' exonuclease [Siminovitchia thermophila]MBM7716422.1 5'-3' exonuclease [Siminovitchia thermophila]